MRTLVFDIETKNIFEEVGSRNPADLDISVVCAHDSETDSYHSFLEDELDELWPLIERADALVGFNSDHFDIPLLNKHYPGELTDIKSIDIMADIKRSLGRRLSLGNVTSATLGAPKSADGLQAYHWWKQGEIEKIKQYCIDDVRLTRELFEYIKKYKKLQYRDGPDLKELPIDTKNWEEHEDNGLTGSLPF